MSSTITWKIIVFASLGLIGLALIGVGSWMLLSSGVQGFGGVQTIQPNPN